LKIGLGSSAAVAAAFARATQPALDRAALFDEALAAHHEFQGGKGSGVDVAASVFGGLIAFQRGASEPARALAPPPGLQWRAVWTGRSADTREFLGRLAEWQDREPARYDRHLGRLLAWAAASVEAFERGSADDVVACAGAACRELAELGELAGIPIVSPVHERLARAAADVGIAYKPSGAGGGDFGLVFGLDPERIDAFGAQARRLSAQVFDLACDPRGACLEADSQS
jgi:phosphomevalonate kinase